MKEKNNQEIIENLYDSEEIQTAKANAKNEQKTITPKKPQQNILFRRLIIILMMLASIFVPPLLIIEIGVYIIFGEERFLHVLGKIFIVIFLICIIGIGICAGLIGLDH